MLSSVCFWFRLTKLVLHRRKPRFKLHFYCDNQSLVRRANHFIQFFDGSFRRSLLPNYDVVFMIACAVNRFPENTIIIRHVKGHQDSDRSTHSLFWPAQLNVLAGRSANTFLQTMSQPMPTPFLPSAQIHLRDSKNTIIIKRWNIHLRSVCHHREYTQWLRRQFQWSASTLNDIDFDGLHATIRGLPTYQVRFVTKWINQALPVRRRVHRYDRHIPPFCKTCPQTIECDTHLLQCPSEPRRSACYDAYIKLENKLKELRTEFCFSCI